MKTKIIYEDENLLVVHKPAGLATQTAKIGQADVVSELKNYLATGKKGNPYLGVIHRLDQPVEGLLVFAKRKEAAAVISGQLARGTLHKQYYAVVCGQPASKEGVLVDYMYKDAEARARVVTDTGLQNPAAQKAVLQYRVCGQVTVSGHEDCLLELMDIHIDTGRFHQIRAQMAHAGMALLGDRKYGDEETGQISRQLGVQNVALCAYKLEFQHPVTKKLHCFTVEPEGKAFSFFCQP